MPQYLCTLGHQPDLSTAELYTVFSALHTTFRVVHRSQNTLMIDTKDDIDAPSLMQRLGGMVKLSKKLVQGDTPSDTITQHLLAAIPEGKLHFSVAPKKLGLEIKKVLKEAGRSVRYIEPKNTATILHNNLVKKRGDFTILDKEVFVTIGIQSLEGFSARDYDRPGSDDLSGMLPPKLARMMINLAGVDTDVTLLDPFCGSGTVLMEAATLGFSTLIGSDLSTKAVADTKKNMVWLKDEHGVDTSYTAYECDARKIDAQLEKSSVDVIVTEPLLGKPLKGNESEGVLRDQAKELSALYIDSFSALHTVLKKDGAIVCVIPQFRHNNEWIMMNCIDAIQKIGFSPTELLPGKNSLLYHRPRQHVGRTVWRLVKM